jgi:asparagine synthase (glutamine-hydrolysing)
MCGIAAAFPPNVEFVRGALTTQVSRGPDQMADVDLGFCGLGVNRLAISGLDGGDQPLVSSDGLITVVFNGAIYNAEALTDEFGFAPASANDGELVHLLYQQFGLGFADRLEGMFAVCLADAEREELVLAVDQVGIKPLYWCDNHGSRLVASTITAFPPSLRGKVWRVPPGTVWSTSGEVRRITHVSYRDGPLGELLTESVLEQIPKEVEWGCMLSGGVDSALVARLASEARPGVPTFTCGTSEGSDLAGAREVAKILGTTHHEVMVDHDELPAVVDSVIRATASMEKWTVMGGVGTYLTARAAHDAGMKVLLSGEGADELFGGYDEFQDLPAAFLNARLVQYQVDLGTSECLRLDRTTMAHSIEARVPYLSTSIIRHARALGPDQKIRDVDGVCIRKYALRVFASTVLPERVAFRDKAEFSHGSGVTAELSRIAAALFPPSAVVRLGAAFPSFPIDDSLSAWFASRWLELFGTTIGTTWESMADRGLFRQRSTLYLPAVSDSAIYG